MPKTNQHPAYQQLHQLATNPIFRVDNAENWRIGALDPRATKEAAVLVLFGILDDQPAKTSTSAVAQDLDLLILVRAATLRHHAGQPAFPGGKIDPQDHQQASPHQPASHIAALREAVEETGLNPQGVEILGSLPAVDLPVSNYLVTPVIAWWKETSLVTVQDSQESAQVLRVPVADLINPANRHTATVKRGPTTHKSPAFTVTTPTGDLTIWGFTGILLDRILTALGWAQPWNTQDQRPAPL